MSTYGNPLTDYSPQMEFSDPSGGMYEAEAGNGILSESDEMELAAEFLEVADEDELENFLDGLFSKVGSALGSIVNSPLGKAVRGVVKKALPIAGAALGGTFGGPLGAAVGGDLASAAGGALGLELEGLSPEDREFEASKQFIRFAAQTAANAAQADEYEDPGEAAHRAAVEAARVHAPGLMDITRRRRRQSGRWIRRDNKIILFGV